VIIVHNQQYNVLIGAGNIGAFFDTPSHSRVLTHAHAFTKHPGFKLVGFVDTNSEKCSQAANLWGGGAYTAVDEAFSENDIDIVTVAVPDEFHYPILLDLAERPIKAVFAEKPLAKKKEESLALFRAYKRRPLPLCVNYTRRFVPEFEELRAAIAAGTFGAFLTGTGYYGKGILHNGSHMIDLLRFLIGDISDGTVVGKVSDFFPEDPSTTCVITFRSGAVFFLGAVDCRMFTIFETDLIFERKRVRIIDSGYTIQEFGIKDDPMYKGYKKMVSQREVSTSMGDALYRAAENIYDHLESDCPLKCTGEDGWMAVDICSRLIGNGK
jgi:predicted dehydrogenase